MIGLEEKSYLAKMFTILVIQEVANKSWFGGEVRYSTFELDPKTKLYQQLIYMLNLFIYL